MLIAAFYKAHFTLLKFDLKCFIFNLINYKSEFRFQQLIEISDERRQKARKFPPNLHNNVEQFISLVPTRKACPFQMCPIP